MEVDHIPGQQIKQEPDQVMNNAGGFVWEVTDVQRLKRFLVLGSEGGTYYVNKRELGLENIKSVARLISKGQGREVVDIIKRFSLEGRCTKQDTIVYCLALCARYHENDKRFVEVTQAAYNAMPEVCRTATDLFHFVQFCEEISKGIDGKTGWGRAHRKAICKWYCSKTGRNLAYQITKYKKRDGWSHADLLRLCHVKANDSKCHALVFKYIIKGYEEMMKDLNAFESIDEDLNKTVGFLKAAEDAMKAQSAEEIVEIIRVNDLVREHVPTQFLSSKKVWHHLLMHMPLTAMIRNLGKMSSMGMFEDTEDHPGSELASHVAKSVTDTTLLKKARIHPFNVLIALKVYEKGKGIRGSKEWKPNKQIVKALDEAFYLSFKFVEPTGKRYMLGVDVSGSMYTDVLGSDAITAAAASAAMAMVTLKSEQTVYPMGFSHHLVDLRINKEMTLREVMGRIREIRMGATDCALPMIHALDKKIPIDVFIIYTDCETWYGYKHPYQALKDYREGMNIPDAKLIVCGMSSTGFTIADPSDKYMLDIVGFDSAAPEIIAQFSLGEI